ncbi:MAG: hypothetical protein C7B43_10580 [Sulfobacillus benefaciens]|uniref:Uncharacterized protein n=1 Tax=Sulfobacillus benefaciens TaxID=453960 RepID=A0A2T2X0Z5_9FIRM|nr:MAG: hypothetical protein C7B43_10580 [Sulfobacillus benefaciens]
MILVTYTGQGQRNKLLVAADLVVSVEQTLFESFFARRSFTEFFGRHTGRRRRHRHAACP